MAKEKAVTDEKLEEAYVILAGIIRHHGDKYLPLFKRLHDEREIRREQRDLSNIALKVSFSKR